MGAYTSDGRRRSSMTHARRFTECMFCGRHVYGNGGWVSHARTHVSTGEAVELTKWASEGIRRAFVERGSREEETLRRDYGYTSAGDAYRPNNTEEHN